MAPSDTSRRSDSSRRAILDAALSLSREVGYPNTSIEAIAKRAGVGKQTIYRWWPSKGAVLLEALNEAGQDSTVFPDTGDLIADLTTQMSVLAETLADDDFAPYTRGLIPAAQSDPALAAAVYNTLAEPRIRECKKRLAIAQANGQLRPDVDLDDAVELLYAGLYYRALVHTRAVSPDDVPRMLDLVFSGLAPQPGKSKPSRRSASRKRKSV